MGKKGDLVGYGTDIDAVSGHINTTNSGTPNHCNISRDNYSLITMKEDPKN